MSGKMKYAFVVPDGMAEWPLEELGGKTPLQAAGTPAMDAAADGGLVGTVRTVPDGFAPGSDVANMSLMGYDPGKYHTGRSPLEAPGIGVAMDDSDVSFRCNLVTLRDGKMADYSAGAVSTVGLSCRPAWRVTSERHWSFS